MSRRSPGEGSITRRKDGRWQASLQLDGRRIFAYGDTRSEAAEKLRALTTQAREAGKLPEGGKLTLAEYLAQWLDQASSRLRPTTLDAYQVIVNSYLVPHIGQVRLSRLDPLRVSRLYATLGKSVSKRRLESVHGLLHKALSDAQRWGLIATNPADQVDAPRRETREPEMLSPEQASLFLQTVLKGEGGRYGTLFGFLLASGCRLGEALGLRWSDIDWEGQTVTIHRQITEVRGKPVELPPKTKSSIRVLVLPDWGVDLLRKQRTTMAQLRLRAGETWEPSERVFVSGNGGVPSRRNVRRALESIQTRLGLPHVSAHDLRHLHLSLLAMNGVPVKVAQARAGHSSPTITLRVYQHVIGDPDRQAARVLDALACV